ncbi:aldo/keto reductase [Teichococcus aestuarii]|uniref:aldo/keto reductase n=1 Tax=Teichococcus aestuarii TaxID=568898 RepID=UPI0036095248
MPARPASPSPSSGSAPGSWPGRRGRRRWRALWRSATAISTPPTATATRRRWGPASPPPAWRGGCLPHQQGLVRQLAPAALRRSLEGSLAKLGTDHLDLFLIHWPSPEMDLAAAVAALEKAKAEGLVRRWGVSNFPLGLMRQLEAMGAEPACLQVEYHVLLSQQPLLEWCRPRGIALAAYSPLGQGALASQPVLAEIGRRHGATGLQVALAGCCGRRWWWPSPRPAGAKASRPISTPWRWRRGWTRRMSPPSTRCRRTGAA